MLVGAGFGDVVADGISLARVGHTAGAALTLRYHRELTVHWRTGQRPAVHLSLQALALLAVLHPGVPAAVGEQAVLMQTLTAEAGVTLRTTEEVCVWVITVTHHPPTHHLTSLAGTDGAAVTVQDPDLTAVLHLVVVDTVSGAVVAVGTATVIASLQVKTHCIIGTGVPTRLTFIYIDTRLPIGREQAVVMVPITALAVVPAGQVDTSGFTITLDKAI